MFTFFFSLCLKSAPERAACSFVCCYCCVCGQHSYQLQGYWVVLDELNLAPSEVLEALNRLLDDNRELFIPETQEVVKPHPHFMLFATQNPPGVYGGRKVLSRAFRNRFLEVHFDDIPDDELETILSVRF